MVKSRVRALALAALVLAIFAFQSGDSDAQTVYHVTWVYNDSIWKYSDRNELPADDWYMPEYNDFDWPSGPAYLGVGETNLRTVLAPGNRPYTTYYFRTTFDLSNAADVESMSFNIDYDDAYALWLNGHLITTTSPQTNWNNHAAMTGVQHNSLLDSPPNAPFYPQYDLTPEQLKYLKNGKNHVAVAIKQFSGTSTDAVMMLTLWGLSKSPADVAAAERSRSTGPLGGYLDVAAYLVGGGAALTLIYYMFIWKRPDPHPGAAYKGDFTHPAAQDAAEGEEFHLEPGTTYLLFEESPKRSVELFAAEVDAGLSGVFVTRSNPAHVRKHFDLKGSKVYWLTKMQPAENEEVISGLQELSIKLGGALDGNRKTAILLDGIEYLVSDNDFNVVLRFVQQMRDKISTSESKMIIPVNPDALEPRQLTLLQRECHLVPHQNVQRTQTPDQHRTGAGWAETLGIGSLLSERGSLQADMKAADDKYNRGLIDDKEFLDLSSRYQKRYLELEGRLRRIDVVSGAPQAPDAGHDTNGQAEVPDAKNTANEMKRAIDAKIAALPRDMILLVSSKSENHADAVTALLDSLIRQRGMGGVYLSFTKPYGTIASMMKTEGIPTEGLFFIDCTSKTAGKTLLGKSDNVSMIENPGSLEEVTMYLDRMLLKVVSQNKFIFLDSLSSLLIYNSEKVVKEFTHFIINRMRLEGISGIILTMEKKEADDLVKTLAPMCDAEIRF